MTDKKRSRSAFELSCVAEFKEEADEMLKASVFCKLDGSDRSIIPGLLLLFDKDPKVLALFRTAKTAIKYIRQKEMSNNDIIESLAPNKVSIKVVSDGAGLSFASSGKIENCILLLGFFMTNREDLAEIITHALKIYELSEAKEPPNEYGDLLEGFENNA